MALEVSEECRRVLSESKHILLQPTPALYSGFLQLAKHILDPLAESITNVQTHRQQSERTSRKRKRKHAAHVEDKEELLRMKKVYVEGFDIDQIWQQAKRVLDAAVSEVEREVPEDEGHVSGNRSKKEGNSRGGAKSVRFKESGLEMGDSKDGSLDDDAVNLENDDEDELMGENAEDDDDIEEEEEDAEEEEEGFDFEDEDDLDEDETLPSEVSEDDAPQEILVKDKFGLNDGFFSIDDFNKQSQFLENQDTRGDPDDGAASDEEDVDWAIDPLSAGLVDRTVNKGRANRKAPASRDLEDDDEVAEDEADDDEEDGPTFGNMDLDAPEGASEDEEGMDGDDDLLGGDFANTNNILYGDFFAPPAKKQGKNKKNNTTRPSAQPSRGSNAKSASENDEDINEDIQRTMSAVRRDFFDDEISEASDTAAASFETGPRAKLSTHERAQQALRAEIRKLEAANVAAKPWYLSGEAVVATRPLNSLLEEDLDFERAGKPVPVITEEVNESLEELIKRRILAREFDEVIRRRPTDLVTGADPRRGRVREELADTKPTKGLAEEYEQEHLKRTDPNFVDTRSEALKKAHLEIEAQWAKVSAQLDALSNWHYKPKPPAPNLEVRVNAPTISLEDARPTTGGEIGGASTLAPQELYRPGEEGAQEGQIVTKGGTTVAKEEETREQRKRRRAREKQRAKKAGENAGVAPGSFTAKGVASGKKASREEVVTQLKKGGAKIIDRKGGLRDVEGNVVRDGVTVNGGAAYRL